MSNAQAAFVTRMARTFKGNSVSRSAYRPGDMARRPGSSFGTISTSSFSICTGWPGPPGRGFGLVNVLWVMAAAPAWAGTEHGAAAASAPRVPASHHTGRK